MPLLLPYKRITRPFYLSDNSCPYVRQGEEIYTSYFLHHEYAPDRANAIRAYHTIESDLIRLFEYVEPHDDNLRTYSTRLYELLLRAATEFESNCKAILQANGYNKKSRCDISDYKKIDSASRLSEYKVKLSFWSMSPKIVSPFSAWTDDTKLSWYANYNAVKHNRNTEFKHASLENVVDSVAALFVILFSQFNIQIFSPHQIVSSRDEFDGSISHHNSIFSIQELKTWSREECYEFSIKDFPDGINFEKFAFN